MAARKGSGDLGETLRRFGMSLPGAHEDHPWGELVLKVKGKVFVFLGKPGNDLAFSVKLPDSGARMLDRDDCEPTGYGLGKSGWVSVRASAGGSFTADELCALIDESYRAVAPKTLLKELAAARGGGAAAAEPAKPAKKAAARKKAPARKKA